MSLPTERTVTGKYINPVTGEPYDGSSGQHYVIFEPVPDRWTDQTGNQILLGGGRVNLATDGTFAEDVVCTDVPGVLPENGRLWRLRQYIGGTWAEPQYLKVPVGDSPIDISDVLSVDLSDVEYVPVPGPKGDAGIQGAQGPQGEPGLDGGLDTGITSGGDLSPSATSPLAVDISPLVGRIVDYSTDPATVTAVEVATTTTVELDAIAQTRAVTWLLMGADGAVFQQEARPSPEDRRNFLALGVVVQDGGSIVLAQSIPTLVEQPINQLYDFLDAIGAFNMSGNTISPNGANLMLDHSSGQVFSRGWNHFDGVTRTKNPHIVTTNGATPASWVHLLRESPLTPSTATSTVDVSHYDADGILTPYASGAVVHQLWIFPTTDGSEIHVLQYGQQVFGSLSEAVDGAASTPIAPNPALPGNAVLLAYLAVTPTAVNLSDPAQAKVIAASAFGGGSGGSGGGGDTSGYARLSGAEFTGAVGTRMDAPESISQYSRAGADTSDRFRRLSDGTQQWGDGTAAPDTELRRLATGLMAFLGTDLLVGQEGAKAYRLRQSGQGLDFEGSGADLNLSVYELADFAGLQHSYLRLESATRLAHALGKWVFANTPLGTAVHTLDGEANQLGFHGATPIGQQAVTGDRSTGEALQNLLQALSAVGLISDTSTAGPAVVETVNGKAGPAVTLGATDVQAVPVTEKGAAGGVATLGPDGKLSSTQAPADTVTSVNQQTGDVLLDAADVQAVPTAEKGAPSGVATLGTDGKVPVAQLPADAVTSVNSLTGDVVLDASSVGALTATEASTLYSTKDSLAFNAKEHGAVADGVTDDQPVIQNLLDNAPAGSTVILPPGPYATGAPIIVPPGKTLRGLRTNLMGVEGLYDPQVSIKPLATFAGVAAIRFLDQTEGGYAAISGEQRVLDLMLDGVNVAAGVDGIQAKGNVQSVGLRDVTIARFPNSGIYCGLGPDNVAPYSWRMHRVMLDNNHAHGMYGDRMVDLTAVDCQAIGNWSNGFMFGNSANSQLVGCRAEWNGNNGYYFTGDWGLGAGSGGALVSGCSTDRNGYHGVYVDVVGTNAPLVISGLMTRRDGRNGGTGGGGYAGVAALNTTMPIIIGGWSNFPGVDDDGTQVNSPEYGGSFTNCAHVQIDNAYLHAATEALHDGGANQTLKLGVSVTYATGTTDNVSRSPAPGSDVVLASEVGSADGVASLDTSGKVPTGQIPSLPASQIGSGTLDAARIPNLAATYLAVATRAAANGVASLDAAGKIPTGQIPSLAASQINSGTFAVERIPDLSSTYLATTQKGAASGVASLDATSKVPTAQIPSLPASQINSGTFATARIPDLSGTYLTTASKGAASGVASLDAATKIPIAQVPSLPASQVTSGTFAAARIPDLSGTYVTTASKGAAGGVASLGADGKIPLSQTSGFPRATWADVVAASPTRWIAHRGGRWIGPENTIEAFRTAIELGAEAVELDVYKLQDGGLVVMHNSTADYTSNLSGSTGGFTVPGVLRGRVDAGNWFCNTWPNDLRIPVFADLLAEIGGAIPLVVHCNNAGSGAAAVAELQKQERADSALIMAWNETELAAARAAGIPTVLLDEDGVLSGQTYAGLLAAGTEYFGINPAVASVSTIQAAAAAGLKILVYTVNRRVDYAALPIESVWGVISDDPWYVKQSTAMRTRDIFSAQTYFHGMLGIVSGDEDRGFFQSPNWYGLDASGTAHDDNGSYVATLQGYLGPLPNAFTIDFDFVIDASDGTGNSLQLTLTKDDAEFDDDVDTTGGSRQPGYNILVRSSGTVDVFKTFSGTTPATKLGGVATAAIATGALHHLRVQVTSTQIIVTRTNIATPNSVTITDSSYRGNMYPHLGVRGVKARWSNLVVS